MERSEFLRRIPKVDLHAHLIATLREDTAKELCAKHGVEYVEPRGDGKTLGGQSGSGQSIETADRAHHPSAEESDLESSLWDWQLRICSALREAEDFQRVARESILDAAKAGVRHREIFWNPTTHHAQAGVEYATAIEGLLAGLREAEAECGVSGLLIPAIRRDESPEAALEMVEWMVKAPHAEAPGIGLEGPEMGNPPEKFWRAFASADRNGLWRTANAGQGREDPRNIETALDLLSCDRIGHGHAAMFTSDMFLRCLNEEMIFVVEYDGTALNAELLRVMNMGGLRLSPSANRNDFAESWAEIVDLLDLSLADCRHLQAAGIAGAWVDHATKRQWSHNWAEEFDSLLAQVE